MNLKSQFYLYLKTEGVGYEAHNYIQWDVDVNKILKKLYNLMWSYLLM